MRILIKQTVASIMQIFNANINETLLLKRHKKLVYFQVDSERDYFCVSFLQTLQIFFA